MSSDCRRLGTRFIAGTFKPLIVKAGATVAEGRQLCHPRHDDATKLNETKLKLILNVDYKPHFFTRIFPMGTGSLFETCN